LIGHHIDGVDVEELLVAPERLGQGAVVEDVAEVIGDVRREVRRDVGSSVAVAQEDNVNAIGAVARRHDRPQIRHFSPLA
jgi:hypothetical protein